MATEIEAADDIGAYKVVYTLHASHLRWWVRSRFWDFYFERIKNGVSFKTVIETWNQYAKRAEDTVYYSSKFTRKDPGGV